MEYDLMSLRPAWPEIFMLCSACFVLVADLFVSDRNRAVTYVLSLFALGGTLVLVLSVAGDAPQVIFDGGYIRDPMSDLLKVSIIVISLFAFVYSKDYLRAKGLFKGEFYSLGLFAVLGMLVMVSSNSFLTLYLGLELLTLCLYALVAFDRDSPKGAEAAMKYFVMGALASGLLLYGISMVYGATGALDFQSVTRAMSSDGMDDKVLTFGLVFIIIGVAFKFGAVPFHMWLPDIYHGAPTAVTLFLSSAPKIAAFAMAMRLLVDGLGALQGHWQDMLIILAVLSLALGNVVAIAQRNIKRMLAYSTISHVGFILLGLLAGTDKGYSAGMFYTIVYALMSVGTFGILAMLSRQGFEAENLEDLKGLNERSPWIAGMMLLLLFSLAGVPPTVGFFAKLFVLEAIVNVDLLWLAVYAVFFSLIGAFYYLRAIKMMYFDKSTETQPVSASADTHLIVSMNGLAMLAFGLLPAPLLDACLAAITS